MADYASLIGTVVKISRGSDCCSQMLSLRSENGIVNVTVTPKTSVIQCRQIRVGMRIAVFYDASLPVPLIYPPQYTAQIVAVLAQKEQVFLGRFGEDLVAEDQTLKLNIGPNTVIRAVNGQRVSCGAGGQTLLVFYTSLTRSIPPQTSPSRIVILC